jgi:hypothetical protein
MIRMTGIFLSYKAEDRPRIVPLISALETAGHEVWWDARISGGEDWRESIARQLNEAKCVIVTWSERSIGPEGRLFATKLEWPRRAVDICRLPSTRYVPRSASARFRRSTCHSGTVKASTMASSLCFRQSRRSNEGASSHPLPAPPAKLWLPVRRCGASALPCLPARNPGNYLITPTAVAAMRRPFSVERITGRLGNRIPSSAFAEVPLA